MYPQIHFPKKATEGWLKRFVQEWSGAPEQAGRHTIRGTRSWRGGSVTRKYRKFEEKERDLRQQLWHIITIIPEFLDRDADFFRTCLSKAANYQVFI